MATAYQRVQKQLGRLTHPELHRLQVQIAKRLNARAAAEAKDQVRRAQPDASSGTAGQKAKGWEEEKYITVDGKAYGPYKYRRWWEGKTLKSKYLGKAEATQTSPAKRRASKATRHPRP